MKRIATLALLLALLLPACALALTGQPYETFEAYYADNLTLINDNENRYLLPLVLSRTTGGVDNEDTYYTLDSDILSVSITVDMTGVIELCDIRLTAPDGIAYGDSSYNDYASLNYHCVAFQMAMDTVSEASDRYQTVLALRNGLAEGGGAFVYHLGAYTVSCTLSGGVVETIFNNSDAPADTSVTDEETSSEPADDGGDDDMEYIG